MIESIELVHFRNYREAHVTLDQGLHLVTGKNAQGKTSLLEAITLVSSGRVIRGMRDAEAIHEGQTEAKVTAVTLPHRTAISVVLASGVRKKAFLNHASLPRASDLLGRLPSVIFSNADLPVVREDASNRRLMMDLELSQMSGLYLRHFTQYKRALEHRNALLKHDHLSDEPHIEIWETQLAEHGAAIREARAQFIAELGALASEIYAELSGGEKLTLAYAPADGGDSAEALRFLYADHRREEHRRGSSKIGPHRDDVRIEIGGKDARIFGSMGQQRSAAISMKLAVVPLLETSRGEPPIVLLDDILSELDQGRRDRLLEWVSRASRQILLTCNEPEQAGETRHRARILRIDQGKVVAG